MYLLAEAAHQKDWSQTSVRTEADCCVLLLMGCLPCSTACLPDSGLEAQRVPCQRMETPEGGKPVGVQQDYSKT